MPVLSRPPGVCCGFGSLTVQGCKGWTGSGDDLCPHPPECLTPLAGERADVAGHGALVIVPLPLATGCVPLPS